MITLEIQVPAWDKHMYVIPYKFIHINEKINDHV
jgi:hypothetical protein